MSYGDTPFVISMVDERLGGMALQPSAQPAGGGREGTARRMGNRSDWREDQDEITECADRDHNELESYAESIIQVVENSRKREREHSMMRKRAESDAERVQIRVSGVLVALRHHLEVELGMRRELENQLVLVRDQLTKLESGSVRVLRRNIEEDRKKEFLEQERARDRCELEQELSILRHHNTELIREGESMRTELEDKKAAISILEELYVKTLSILHFISAKRENERDAARSDLEEEKKRLRELRVLHTTLERERDAVRSELQDTQKAFIIVCDRNKRLKINRDTALCEVQAQKEALLVAQERNAKLESEYDVVCRELQLERIQVRKLVNKRDSIKRELDEEKEKSLCQICLENPRDTLTLPCVHLHYCFECLQEHHMRSKTCPTCRFPTNGVLQCSVSLE